VHFYLVHRDLRLSQEFNSWKRSQKEKYFAWKERREDRMKEEREENERLEKANQKLNPEELAKREARLRKEEEEKISIKGWRDKERSGWGPGVVNWHKFELRLRYYRRWRKIVKSCKRERWEEIQEIKSQEKKEKQRHAREKLANHAPLDPFFVEDAPPSPVEPAIELTKEEWERKRQEWLKEITKALKKKLGEDVFYHYKFLGESYAHGMMDGAAMEIQNRELIPPRIFELR